MAGFMKVNKHIITFVLVLILLNQNSFAYIDPGTGGYLIQSLWAWIVGVAAFLVAIIGHFFRVTLVLWIKHLWNYFKFGILVIGTIFLVGLAFAILQLIPDSLPQNPDFDPSISGVHWHNKELSVGGYNLYEGKLIDMNGNVVNQWNNAKYLGVIDENGDYYAQQCFECLTWGRYTWNDTVIWEQDLPIHHEILLTPWDTIYTFTKEIHEYHGRNVEWDVIIEVDKNGTIIDQWSTWENFDYLHSFHAPLELDKPWGAEIGENTWKNTSIWGGNYDYYHLNSMSLVPNNSMQGRHPAFNPGNWVISMRHGSMLFILDKDTKKVLWTAIYDQISDGRLEGQHTPFMLEDGTILVFDNGRWRGWSRVLEIDPVSLDITWEYKTEDPSEFFTLSQGQVQLLENGNYQLVESERGRVFEINRDGKILWEFYHPEKQNSSNSAIPDQWGKRQQIYRMTRYTEDFISQFIQ